MLQKGRCDTVFNFFTGKYNSASDHGETLSFLTHKHSPEEKIESSNPIK